MKRPAKSKHRKNPNDQERERLERVYNDLVQAGEKVTSDKLEAGSKLQTGKSINRQVVQSYWRTKKAANRANSNTNKGVKA